MAGANPLGIIEGLLEVEDRIGGFIKGDIGGDSAIANHFRDQYRARCEEFTNAPGWLQGFVGLGAGGAISRICKPYLDDNEWDSPELGTPFTGGQCSFQYNVFVAVTRFPNSDPGDVTTTTISTLGNQGAPMGPITGVVVGPASSFDVGGSCSTGDTPAVGCSTANGNWLIACYANSTIVNAEITSVVPFRSSDNDDCGDPEPVPVPGPNPAPMPDPIRLPGGQPRPNPRNRDGLPDIPVDPFPDPIFGPGLPALPDGFGFGGGRSGGGGAGRSFDPIENDDEDGGQDEEFDEPPEGEVWVGAYLELTKVPINITTVPGTGPENGAYFRIVGNFSIFSDSEGSRLYSDSVQVRNRWTKFIGNPQGLPVNGARVSVLPGVRYRVIPVSAPADPDRNGEE